MPVFHSDNKIIDEAYRIAMEDIASNVVSIDRGGPPNSDSFVLRAGADYGLWIRDAAVNAWNGSGLLYPKETRNSMLPFLSKANDTYFFNKTDQLWDAMIWTVGSWWYYIHTLDKPFLETAFEISKDIIAHFEEGWFDEKQGLFRGGAVFIDSLSGYPDEIARRTKGSDRSKEWSDWRRMRNDPSLCDYASLSMNCIYYYAYVILDKMQRMLDSNVLCNWMAKAAALKRAINARFWDDADQHYRYIAGGGADFKYQEGLGHSLCILLGIADKRRADSVLRNQSVTKFGAPAIWPPFQRFLEMSRSGRFGRQSGLIWPHVNGFWAHAAALSGRYDLFEAELLNLAELAVRDGQYAEAYHPLTGEAYGGLSDYPMTPAQTRESGTDFYEWKTCSRQTWCATAFFRMLTMGIFGMNFTEDGLSFRPYLPEWSALAELKNLHYADMVLNVRIEGCGSRIKQLMHNGRECPAVSISNRLEGEQTIEIVMEAQREAGRPISHPAS